MKLTLLLTTVLSARRTVGLLLLWCLLAASAAWAQVPTISSLSPTSGPAGTSVTITGTNLTNTRSVVLRGIPCNFTPISATQVSFVVPAQASTGAVRLTTAGGNVLSGSTFTVTRASSTLNYKQLSSDLTNTTGNQLIAGVAVTDLDKDGLVDLLQGNDNGTIAHYEQSAANATTFVLRTATLAGVGAGSYPHHVVTDLDGDGLLDLLVGNQVGNVHHYEQTTANGSAFTLVTNSFAGIAVSGIAAPTITDLDGDGLLDLLVGSNPGAIAHYEQNVANSTSFTLRTAQFGSFNFTPYTINGSVNSTPHVTDLDGDGLLDLVVGTFFSSMLRAEQTAANSTSFGPLTTLLPLGDGYDSPFSADLDGDGLLDLLIGSTNGDIRYLEQYPTPTITSFTPPSGPVGTSVTITGTNLNEVTVATVNGVAGTITGTPTATSLTFTVGAGSATGAVSVTSPGGTATGSSFTVIQQPVVTSVAVPANATYGIGQNLNFTVNFDQAVTVTGTPTLALTVGAAARTASYVSGSGSTALVFRYTVPSGDADTNGVALGSAISLNGGTIRNASSLNAILTLNSVGSTTGVLVDGVAPLAIINSSVGASGSSTTSSPIPFSVTFSESVSGFGISSITVTNGTKSGLTGSGGFYTFNVTPTAAGIVRVDVAAGVAADATGNGNIPATQFSITYAPVTTVAPVLNNPVNASSSTDTTPTYSGTAPAGSTVTVYVDGVSIGTVNANPGNGNWSKTQSPALADGTYTVYATAQTTGQLVSANSNTNTFTIDNADPTVSISSSAGANGSTTSTNPIPFTVTFSEDVTGLVIGDIVVTGGTKSALTMVSASQYTFTMTPSGAGPITVNIATSRATDAAGNGNTAAAQFSITYAPAPTLSNVSPSAELPGMPVVITGTGFTAASTVSFGGVAASSVTYTSATSLTATVPASAAVSSSTVVVTTGGAPSTGSPAFSVLKVYDAVASCLTTTSYTATGDGAWHYLLAGNGQVVAALQDTRAALGSVSVQFLITGSASAVRQDAKAHRYLDRNWHLIATNPTFTGSSLNVRFYGLTSEFGRLVAADASVTYANLKATQYSGANEDCQLGNNLAAGQHRTLSLSASTPGNGVVWFVAQASVPDHFSEFYLTGSTAPLPVELTSFTAEQQGTAVRLAWATASEKNSAYFDIERSTDGREFAKIGRLAAQGSKTSPSDYAYLDDKLASSPTRTHIYYRLRQVDQNGSSTYSPVRDVVVGGKGQLALFPNPTAGGATLIGTVLGTRVRVFDSLGREVSTATADAAGTATLPLSAGLPAGVYVVRAGARAIRLVRE
ncbi:FG-GAP-like repeat-containing protein [Hymenobacter negativus]|uniref:VCBS repeat-containing protein n=1 Tax=Hymenobacter negativus TaxID=2795026 RepID=A0ABS3QNV5_9BACT|nr:FG-GAP-like repeat-containing protein [Hymenobacter negativus]MBO2012787.1 VCBS repeat-containing protein [Hymenobacter negativus]